MPIVSFFERTRTRGIHRVKPRGWGNLLTKIDKGKLYAALLPPTPELYPTYKLYEFPETKDVRVIYPPIKPPFWRLIGYITTIQEVIPPPLPEPVIKPPEELKIPELIKPAETIVPTPAPPTEIVVKVDVEALKTPQPVVETSFPLGATGFINFDEIMKLYFITEHKVITKDVVLYADPANTSDIWMGFAVAPLFPLSFPIKPGASAVVSISDPRKLAFLVTVAGQKLYYFFTYQPAK